MTKTIDAVDTEQPVKKPLRITELVLSVLAVAIGLGAYMLSGLGMDQQLEAHYWIQLGVMFSIAIAFYFVYRLRSPFAYLTVYHLVLSLFVLCTLITLCVAHHPLGT